jgi:mono/diheme cytochrome c family protein
MMTMMHPFRSITATALALVTIGTHALSQEGEVEDPIGLTEYELACMSCHGLDGKGDGPKARTLSTMPADLTRLASGNGGIFPARAIADMIDGRGVIPAHGKREMPVWGDRYRKTGDPGEDPAKVDKRARALIEAIVGYLQSIQQK